LKVPFPITGKLAYPQTKIDTYKSDLINLSNEVNFELSKQELIEAAQLSGYAKQDKEHLLNDFNKSKNFNNNIQTNTQRMWAAALAGVWKTMIDIDGWKLPGVLNKYNICGKGFYKKCDSHSFVRGFVYHCGRLGCEICAKRAGARTAKKIERRIWLYKLYIEKVSKGRKHPSPSHIIEAIDPKDDFWKWSKQKQTSTIAKIRKRVGIYGGAEINHLWAFDKSNYKPFYRPHKHLIAYGWLNSNHTKIIQKEFGIKMVYHKVKNGTLKTRLDVFGVAFYQLSHAAIKNNKHSVRWFGALSYSKISNEILEKYKDEEYVLQDEIIEKTKRCDLCNEKLIPAKIDIHFRNWRQWLPPLDELTGGCRVKDGLFLLVDFMSGEKIPYYDENHEEFYKLKKSEQLELKKIELPHLYDKKTINHPITNY